ncbi:Asp-tRNA(Asn)/Glu-tRNA(Gln) amidotransferase subunit GatA [Lactobacillus sp. DCY120]|uniref:Glutamyl-tRNA(Gln) amidotransferase subunit A n=1 Tax=Bombilactobacillus apium TaxID=2675299 RepID=A0A850RBM4_9LACO|nr:Asp-tRNA(Asn)/Glu-tRNA(Gln) amidotransferase subunit GatA [Bombilactobacillus apium]NVY96716.1 Asp-tRNA(Asn)/Glu-tRNA(Gln) amidotransferase subunit GatA [Bombilactobacillus apium]
MNYFDETIASLHQKLQEKKLSAAELKQATLDQIKATNPTLNSFIAVNEAATVPTEISDQVLAGIPLAIKDNILTKELKTTAASKMLANFQSVYESTVTTKLLKAGMVNIGKTNMDEFAMGSSSETSYFGAVKNPWDTNKVPGGSSGGSAAAVAAGQVLAALGTDTGGSVRQPAAFNGVFGIKPTYGRVSRWGVIAFSSSLDQVGVLSRHVADSAQILQTMSGYDEHDSTSSATDVPDFVGDLKADVRGMKIAVPAEFMGSGVDGGVKAEVQKAIDLLVQQGAQVDEVHLPHTKYSVPAYYIIASSEASSNLQRYDGIRYGYRASDAHNLEEVYVKSRTQGFGPEVQRRIMLGTFALSAGYFDAYFTKAAQVRTLLIQEFDKIFADYDLIVGPTTPTTAFDLNSRIDDPVVMYMNDILTIPANLAGLPAASVPVGLSAGMPVGVQLIARPFAEQTIFNAAQVLENETDFLQNRPLIGGQN